MDMKLEVVVVPVADVDRAKDFYTGLAAGCRPRHRRGLPGGAGDPARLTGVGHLRRVGHVPGAGPAPDRGRHRRHRVHRHRARHPRAPQYAAAKYAILGITKSYAAAFAPTVRVNTFAPGFIETEATLNRHDWKSGRREAMIARTPMGRIPAAAELAGTALFLATDDAAHITGVYLNADGGYNMIGA
ncbi:SDR family oxidoreductase [Nonomuraea sp. NPDC049709]|uniref:SDR family NAD(P)-dependent oxidoreductase n=1 Tax=Nonomuraea sp. NPDC049709 TaxID=3154736 RepID=UPI0034253357